MPARCAADTVAGEPAASSGHRAALRSQNALAAFPKSAPAYPARRPPAVRAAHARSRNEYLLAIARENDAGSKTASTRGRWKIVRVVSGWGF